MRRIAGVALSLSLLGLLAAPAGAAGAPEAHLGSSNVALGDRVLVQGSGWPAGSLVLLQLCGNGAIDTSADCALTTGINAGVGADGTFSMLLNVERPPTACPCVVWVTDSASTADAKVPIQVVGLPSEVLRQRTPVLDLSKTVKVSAKITGGSWTTFFGAGSTRTLELTVQNTGTMAIPEPRTNITFGKGKTPSGFVAPPAIGTIAAGATQTYKVPVSVDTFSFGKYTLNGELAGFGTPVPFHTSISVYPWGLLLVAIALLQLGLLYFRDRARNRLAEGEGIEHTVPVPVVTAPPVAAASTTNSSRWQEPLHWAQAEWAAAAVTVQRVLRRAQVDDRSAALPPTKPAKPAPASGDTAWVAAAAAWGRGTRGNGKDSASRQQRAHRKQPPAAPRVIDLTDAATTEAEALESLALLPEVDNLSYYVTELYSGVLPAKNGTNGHNNGHANNGANGKTTNGANARLRRNIARKAAASSKSKTPTTRKATANGKSKGVATKSTSRPRATAKS